ncbi:MAG: hypothetical protein ABI637_00745 [Gemmatimonadota bacterium]
MPIKSQAQEAHAAKPVRGGSGNTGIYYNGGRVLSTGTRVVAIYWSQSSAIYAGGPTPTSAGATGAGGSDGSLIGYFLQNFGASSYFNINTTYTDRSGAVPLSVAYLGYFADNTGAPTGTQNVTDAQIQAEVVRAITVGKYSNDQNTIYVVFTEGTVNLGGGFGTQYCAYHGHFSYGGKDVLFAAQPYTNAYPSSCTNGTASPNGDPGADATINTLAHEIEEAATDPDLNAWFDRRGYENADKCAWTWGTTYNSGGGVANMKIGAKDFLIQRNWINLGSGGCYRGLDSTGPIA